MTAEAGDEPTRVLAPFGRRRSEVVANEISGGYRIVTARDSRGPTPAAGQFYMLAAERGWGGGGERPFLPRAFSVAEALADDEGVLLSFLLEDVGPGTHELAGLRSGDGLLLTGPLGRPFSPPHDIDPDAAGAILVGGGIGLAPLALWRRTLAALGIPERSLLGFRDEAHSGGMELFRCSEVRLASEDGHAGHRGYVTDLLARMLEGDSARTAVVYSCGPPGDAGGRAGDVRGPWGRGGAGDGVPDGLRLRGVLRMRGATARGRIHAALRGRAGRPGGRGGDGAGRGGGAPMSTGISADRIEGVELCGIPLAHPIINASGTFDVIAARRAFGDAVLERFPFSAYVSKTITPVPRVGNPPPRLWEEPAAMVNSIGLPNKGLEGFLTGDLPQLAELPVPLIVSVMATSVEQFGPLVSAVAERPEVAALELNVSCPNVHSGLIVGEQPTETESLLEALRPLTVKPLIVKLTPNVAEPAADRDRR